MVFGVIHNNHCKDGGTFYVLLIICNKELLGRGVAQV